MEVASSDKPKLASLSLVFASGNLRSSRLSSCVCLVLVLILVFVSPSPSILAHANDEQTKASTAFALHIAQLARQVAVVVI